ncbi:MAG: DUF2505 domain-containing protein [Actinomycetota bacterium]
MRFEVEHSFAAPADRLAALLLDLDFQNSLADIGGLSAREVLLQETDGDEVIRHVRCVLDIQINGAARRFIGSGEPAWVEVARWIPAEMAWIWEIEPEVGGDLLEAQGRILIEKAGKGALRRVEGDIKVKVPLYGGRVEGWIADGLETAYDEEARRISAAL